MASNTNPAELPAELSEGGSAKGVFRPRPNPAEIPVFLGAQNILQELLSELVQTRTRVHDLEIAQLIARFRPPRGPGPGPQELPAFRSYARYWPNELPEGGEGGGGGVIPRPSEINELPIDFSRFLQELTQLASRLANLENVIQAQGRELAELKLRKG